MTNLRHKQRGLSGIGLILILGLIAFFALLFMKIFPLYLENFKVKSALTEIVADPEAVKLSKKEIRNRFLTRMDVEDVDMFSRQNLSEFLTIEKTRDSITLDMNYDAETKLVSNLTLIANFNDVISSDDE